ncbi:MAG: DUF721 domain-containing protein [Pirellulaceae bacterium]|nr:DUF721 domain-containing protein [Pirellulaceae bacterium]
MTPEQRELWDLQQIKQRPSRVRAKHIGHSMRNLMARHGLAQTQAANELAVAWQSAVGPQLSALTRPCTIQRGVLQVLVRDSSALQELQLCRKQVLAALQQALPQANIRDLRGKIA